MIVLILDHKSRLLQTVWQYVLCDEGAAGHRFRLFQLRELICRYVARLFKRGRRFLQGQFSNWAVFLTAATNNVLASGSLGPAGTIDRAECDWVFP